MARNSSARLPIFAPCSPHHGSKEAFRWPDLKTLLLFHFLSFSQRPWLSWALWHGSSLDPGRIGGVFVLQERHRSGASLPYRIALYSVCGSLKRLPLHRLSAVPVGLAVGTTGPRSRVPQEFDQQAPRSPAHPQLFHGRFGWEEGDTCVPGALPNAPRTSQGRGPVFPRIGPVRSSLHYRGTRGGA